MERSQSTPTPHRVLSAVYGHDAVVITDGNDAAAIRSVAEALWAADVNAVFSLGFGCDGDWVVSVRPMALRDARRALRRRAEDRPMVARPMPGSAPAPPVLGRFRNQAQRLHAVLGVLGITDHKAFAAEVVGRPVESFKGLTSAEIQAVEAAAEGPVRVAA